ncbi:GNAT family N-acetyltransferase [Streptosporangium sp. NPDC000239]|uniref:GNAT family N-acetyltransferase n=1 Tax=Streptosporangium sp. NPDC000239 TaxID=3154248 RepID=UPI0033167F98
MTSATVESFVPRHATEVDLTAWCEVFGDGQREASGDSPSVTALAGRLLAEEAPAVPRWVARGDDARPVVGVAELRPQSRDPRVGFLRLFVAPSARRAGVGSALLTRIAEDARRAGLERIQATAPAGEPGEAFARTWRGARELLRLERQEQSLDETVLRRCRDLAACPDPARYRPVYWHGPVPEPLVLAFGQAMGHVLDAPGAALQMASRQGWDREAVRAWEARLTAGGEHVMAHAALWRDTGQVVAATVITVAGDDARDAAQHDTVVLPQHRRRGLARWIKARHTLLLHERFPCVRTVGTTVNQRNLPMIAVNRTVGYRTVHERLLMELPLADGARR